MYKNIQTKGNAIITYHMLGNKTYAKYTKQETKKQIAPPLSLARRRGRKYSIYPRSERERAIQSPRIQFAARDPRKKEGNKSNFLLLLRRSRPSPSLSPRSEPSICALNGRKCWRGGGT